MREGARQRGMSRHTYSYHCQEKVGQPTCLPIAWASLPAEWSRRAEQSTHPYPFARLLVCTPSPSAGCIQHIPNEDRERMEATPHWVREAVGQVAHPHW